MLLTQHLPRDKHARDHPTRRQARVQDPHVSQTPRERLLHGAPLPVIRDGPDREHVRRRRRPREVREQGRGQACGAERRLPQRHAVLEDDAAEHDRRRGREVADEAQRRGRSGGVVLRDPRLQGEQGWFEEETRADAGDELDGDDLAQRGGRGEVDVEAVADREEGHAEPDELEVAACVVDEEAGGHGGHGFGQHEGQDEQARVQRGGFLHGLEVERKVVFAGDEDLALYCIR